MKKVSIPELKLHGNLCRLQNTYAGGQVCVQGADEYTCIYKPPGREVYNRRPAFLTATTASAPVSKLIMRFPIAMSSKAGFCCFPRFIPQSAGQGIDGPQKINRLPWPSWNSGAFQWHSRKTHKDRRSVQGEFLGVWMELSICYTERDSVRLTRFTHDPRFFKACADSIRVSLSSQGASRMMVSAPGYPSVH